LYAMVGAILAAFPIPGWVWGFAILGILVQIITLAGPQALRRFRWLAANLLVLGSSLGAGLVAIALAIALNHAGTDQLDDLTLTSVFWDVVRYSLLAVVLAAISSGVTAALGDRLLRQLQQKQTVLILGVTAALGLGLGGMFGILIQQG
jgi:predicted membrane channel-forming protein YqfA (hemolysin III family)